MLTNSQREVLISRLRRGREVAATAIPRRPAGLASLPLSSAQQQVWFIDQFAPGQPTYNIPLAVTVSGPLDERALRRAIECLVTRHEALRTRLVPGEHGQPVQVIDPAAPVPLELRDASGMAPERREAWLRDYVGAEALRPLSLSAGPLLRTTLVRFAGDSHVLAVVVHHVVFDGWSARILLTELAALYRHEATGEPSGLADLPVQFADYAVWERDRLQSPVVAELEQHWRRTLAGLPTVHFPADRPRPVLEDFDGGLATRMIDRGLLDGLRELSRQHGATLFVTVLAGLLALLYRYTGQTDLVVGTVSASRSRPELAPLIGFLVNTLPIRADLSDDPAFTGLLDRVREATAAAYAHQDLPFARIVDALRVERDPSRSPVFQIALTFAERDATPVPAAGAEFALSDLVVGIRAAKFDLDFAVEARSEGLWFECSYKTTLFDAERVRRLLGHFEVLLRGVLASPAAKISELPVLTDAELRRELVEWNDTAAPFPERCIHQGFAAQVARTPDAIAASYAGQQVSYGELNRQANQIARRLRAAGVGPEVLVGVCMGTSLRRLAALLGIMKAGGGYVPLDPALPAERLSFMIADTGMAVVLADGAELADVDLAGAAVLSLEERRPQVSELDDTDLDEAGPDDPGVVPSNVAYVIYTSGSTGQPKGVVVEHRNASNFLQGMIGAWRIGPADVVLQFASLGFDASVQEMYMPLLAGAKVVLAPPDTLHSARRLADLMRDHRVTFTFLTPSVVSLLRHEQLPDLRVLMCGGEEMPSELVRDWLRPGLVFANDYGPTETTVSALFMPLEASTPLPPPVGRPCQPGYRAYVLDAHLNPVPVGVTGELHIGGAGVARGYLNRPELTSQRFIADPFIPGQRLYKTGDLVRRRPDGTIVFLGRIDHQVKLRGLRIELGEIEAALAAHPAVAQAVVTVTTSPAGDKQLAGYLRPAPGATAAQIDAADVRAHLARTLPSYMIPAHLVTLEAVPLTASGKIDRAALPPPMPAATSRATPATALEEALTRCYAAVLNRSDIGVTDSFFHAGGNSLQVMRLVDLISTEIGAEVGAATVFLHPAPRQLAAHIDAIETGADRPVGSGPLLELSTGVGALPFFLIHPVGGTVFSYADLAGELGDTFKVYGLEAPALSESGAIASELTDLVRDYTARIKAAQPAGPYRLGGWSMGGVVALEAARRLESEGAEVCLLALLDAPFAVPVGTAVGQAEFAGRFLTDAMDSMGMSTSVLPDPATTTAPEQLDWLAERLSAGLATISTGNAQAGATRAGATRAEATGAEAARLRRRFDVFQAHSRMLAGYAAAPSIQAPTLVVSADDSLNAQFLPRWPGVLAGPVCTLRVASDHYAFLRHPLVAEVGAAILKWHGERA